ncbi:MAG: division/cell wall cluster transcriptional repressor MraZ [bacterium]
MDYFLGTYDYTIDDNNRLSIPAKFRKVMTKLGKTNFIVSKEQENYLTLYPYTIWNERIGAKIFELPHSDKKANRLRRLIGLNTTEVTLDKQGRINIPTDYYKHAGIEKKIKIIGSVDTIQLWNPDNYEKVSQTPEEKSLIEEFEEFGI